MSVVNLVILRERERKKEREKDTTRLTNLLCLVNIAFKKLSESERI